MSIQRGPTRVVVVDDSNTQRAYLVDTLETDPNITVVGEAIGAQEAVDLVERTRPDVVTLDLQIPEGGGQYAIEQIMAQTPTAILVLSGTISDRQSAPAVEALMAGAVEVLPKPDRWTGADEITLRRLVRSLGGVTVVRHHRGRLNGNHPSRFLSAAGNGTAGHIVAIAASTGGPPAIADILSRLDGLHAPVLVVQHLHRDFIEGLVSWMDRISALPVKLAEHGMQLERGTVYLAPADAHLLLAADACLALNPEPQTLHRPSADELFHSVAAHARSSVGVLLTGMGRDGAVGLQAMHKAGAVTIAQDEASSAVFGMPKAALDLGAVSLVLPLDEIAPTVLRVSAGARS